MKDKLGKEIKQGAWVDVYLAGMFAAYVSEVDDGMIFSGPGQVPSVRQVTLNVVFPMRSRDGVSLPVYVVKDPEPEVAPEASETIQ